ncbi:MAG: ribonuclease T2, partial [Pseudomonadota bacterium]|nr:ribonuclease T2 [Pseudomonadota bacterium]
MTPFLGRHIAWLGFALAVAAADGQARQPPRFDYYVLALSWSPTYCSSPAGAADGSQCSSDKRFAFIVHGLWPQYRAGWPEFCDTPEPRVPDTTIAAMLPVMPSPQLIVHQWRKHGSCSGLPIADYFALVQSLFAKVRIPARYLAPTAVIATNPGAIVSDFVKSNRGLDPSMISVRCGSRKRQARLAEVRICFARDGGFAACGRNEHPSCKAASLHLPPARSTSSP